MTQTNHESTSIYSPRCASPFGAVIAASLCLLSAVGACAAPRPTTSLVAESTSTTSSGAGSATAAPDPAPDAQPMRDGQSVARVAQQTETTQTFMRRHYLESVDIREAIVAASLADMHRAASAVASDAWTPRLRDDYAPYVRAMREHARAVVAAQSLRDGVTALGDLGAACGDCHRKFGGPGSTLPPEPLQGVKPAMVEHAAATDALWQGLVGPSDAVWRAGAQTLLDAPALDSDSPDVAAAARHLRALAQEALTVPVNGRPKVLGNVLLTCAACHENLGVALPRPAFLR